MDLLMVFNIQHFYEFTSMRDAIRNGYSDYGYASFMEKRFHHNNKECGADFSLDYRWHGYNHGGFCDSSVRCPKCGKRAVNRYRDVEEIYTDHGTGSPISMCVALYETANGFQIRIDSLIRKFVENGDKRVKDFPCHEVIDFDAKDKRTTYTKKEGRRKLMECELGNPFDNFLSLNSNLSFLKSDNGAVKYKNEIRELLAMLRNGIQKKFKKFHGFRLGNIYTNILTGFKGKMITPISFIAFRLLLPDIKRLPPVLESQALHHNRWCTETASALLFDDLSAYRKKCSSVQVIMSKVNLPNCRAFRKKIAAYPFEAQCLSVIYHSVGKVDTACRLFDVINGKFSIEFAERIVNSFIMKWPTKAIEAFLEQVEPRTLKDALNLYDELTNASKPLVRDFKLKDVHDKLVKMVNEQRNSNYSLDIPEHIRRRFEMQKDSLKFFLPDTAWQLRDGGREFSNCVYTYAKRVKDGECQIAFMSDDKGKLVACLEIRGDKLVQAKLKFNRPVKQDDEVQQEIIKWCKVKKIKIKTDDVEERRPADGTDCNESACGA